jgi:hypothetical protein
MARLAQPAMAYVERPSPRAVAAAGTAGNPGSAGAEVGGNIRLHLLGDLPSTALTALSPEPAEGRGDRPKDVPAGRPSLIVRRRSRQGETLRSTFVTLIEPVGPAFPPLVRVGRVDAPPEVVVVLVQTVERTEYLLVNLEPGTARRVQLPTGRFVSFDGLAVRVRDDALALAGGTFAEGSGRLASLPTLEGTITGAVRQPSRRGTGWFVTGTKIDPDPALSGKTLVIEHGNGNRRAWTLNSIEPIPQGTRLHVREEPGFSIDPDDGSARYALFPEVTEPGPHRFQVFRIAR